jgi:hypothetical protein
MLYNIHLNLNEFNFIRLKILLLFKIFIYLLTKDASLFDLLLLELSKQIVT